MADKAFFGSQEMFQLISQLDLTMYDVLVSYNKWKDSDRTKDGLVKLLQKQERLRKGLSNQEEI